MSRDFNLFDFFTCKNYCKLLKLYMIAPLKFFQCKVQCLTDTSTHMSGFRLGNKSKTSVSPTFPQLLCMRVLFYVLQKKYSCSVIFSICGTDRRFREQKWIDFWGRFIFKKGFRMRNLIHYTIPNKSRYFFGILACFRV